MKIKLQLYVLATLVCFYSGVTYAQQYTSAQIDSLVTHLQEVTTPVGMAIAVVKDGEVIHSKGYGLASYKTGKKVDKNTLFAIASNSKAFTSAALAILVDEEKLSWDDKVVQYIPEFTMYDDYVTANFTVIDLLTHRSGLGLGAGDLMFFPDGTDFTMDDILKSFQYQKPISAFRTKYDYDNLLYMVAGELVKRISGQSWVDFVKNRIMNPIGMVNSVTVSSNLPDKGNYAMPHHVVGDSISELPVFNIGKVGAPAGGIYASVAELTNWLKVQLNGGKYGKELSQQLFSEKQQYQMWKPHTNTGFTVIPHGPNENHFSAYGLGWNIYDSKGKIVLEHTGGLPGMLSRTILVPELNLGIVVLTNADPGGYGFYSLPETILNQYLEIPQNDFIGQLAGMAKATESESDSVTVAVWQKVKNNAPMPFKKEQFTGVYKDNWFGEVEVKINGDKLWFYSKRSPKLNGEMFYYNATTFAVKWEYTDMPCDAFAIFSLDENGNATGIKMKGISPNIDFSFDFQDLDLKRVD